MAPEGLAITSAAPNLRASMAWGDPACATEDTMMTGHFAHQAQALEALDAIHVGHLDVQQNQVRGYFFDLLERFQGRWWLRLPLPGRGPR
jgi:hypothetical protein